MDSETKVFFCYDFVRVFSFLCACVCVVVTCPSFYVSACLCVGVSGNTNVINRSKTQI